MLEGGEIGRSPVISYEKSVDPLEDLFSRRLIFVMGKGGVGKTTVGISLAGIAAQRNKKVLLVELGDAETIGRLYSGRALPRTPVPLAYGVQGARVDARAELEAYLRAHIPSKFIAGKISRSRLFDYLFEAAPGLKEIMSLGRLWRWEQQALHLSNAPFDLIIVDAPASGHAASLLRLPDALIKMIRVGPMVNQLRGLEHLLKDHQKTVLVLVTLPEELPVNEMLELYHTARDSLDMGVAASIVNSTQPVIFSAREMDQIHSIKKMYPDPPAGIEKAWVRCAQSACRQQLAQERHIRRILDTVHCPVMKLPFCFTNDMTLEQIAEMSLTPVPPVSNLQDFPSGADLKGNHS